MDPLLKAAADQVLKRSVTEIARGVALAVEMRMDKRKRELRRKVSAELFTKQRNEAEADVAEVIAPVIREQLKSISRRLMGLHAKGEIDLSAKSVDAASSLMQQCFDPKEWRAELINRALPVMAVRMAEAAKAQLLETGLRPSGKGRGKP